jgi:hypothetical protein
MSLPENRRTPTELPAEFFRRKYLMTELIPSQKLSVFTDRIIPSVYTDGIADGEKLFLKFATA